MNNILEQLQREIDQLKRQVEAFQSGGYATANWTYLGTSVAPQLTSDTWDGDAYSTTAKTLIDLSVVFGAPARMKAVMFAIAVRDEAAASGDYYMRLAPNDTADSGVTINCIPVNDRYNRACLIVPCTADGDVYYQIAASGAGTFDVSMSIWGYCL